MFRSDRLGKWLGLFFIDPTIRLHITFIASNNNDNVLIISMVLQFSDPFLNLLKGLAGDNLVDNDSPDSIPIVDRGDCIVQFLPGGVPDGKLHHFIIMIGQFEIFLQVTCIYRWWLIIIELVTGVF